MAALLLDIDGVLHVSGRPLPGAARALAELRAAGHRLRLVTNTTTRPRAVLAAELRAMGFDVGADELQTPAPAAARALAGRRVLALVLPALREDLAGLELVDEEADAVLVGGAGEPRETGEVFAYERLDSAFSALLGGAELFCLHRNRWWQTAAGPRLDAGAFVAALEEASGRRAGLLGKPAAAFFAAALEALAAEPQGAVMVGDDVEADVAGAQRLGLRGLLVRTGKFRAETLQESGVAPDAILGSIAELPGWLRSGG